MVTLVYSLEPSRRAQRTTPGQLTLHTPYGSQFRPCLSCAVCRRSLPVCSDKTVTRVRGCSLECCTVPFLDANTQPRAPPYSRSVFPGVLVPAHPVAVLPLPVVIARRPTQRLRGGGARGGDLLGVADRRQQVLFDKGAHLESGCRLHCCGGGWGMWLVSRLLCRVFAGRAPAAGTSRPRITSRLCLGYISRTSRWNFSS